MVAVEHDEELAVQLMALVLSRKLLQADPCAPSGHRLPPSDATIRRLRADPHIARSYAGATYQQGYADFDPAKLRVELDRGYSSTTQGIDYPEPGRAKFFLRCGGADTPRPVTLARNSAGQWKVTSLSSLTVGVRRPASEAGDF